MVYSSSKRPAEGKTKSLARLVLLSEGSSGSRRASGRRLQGKLSRTRVPEIKTCAISEFVTACGVPTASTVTLTGAPRSSFPETVYLPSDLALYADFTYF